LSQRLATLAVVESWAEIERGLKFVVLKFLASPSLLET
jgi:hypothetical protein